MASHKLALRIGGSMNIWGLATIAFLATDHITLGIICLVVLCFSE